MMPLKSRLFYTLDADGNVVPRDVMALGPPSDIVKRKCRHCNNWFKAGVGTGRRADAMFCSDEHRKRFNSLERSR